MPDDHRYDTDRALALADDFRDWAGWLAPEADSSDPEVSTRAKWQLDDLLQAARLLGNFSRELSRLRELEARVDPLFAVRCDDSGAEVAQWATARLHDLQAEKVRIAATRDAAVWGLVRGGRPVTEVAEDLTVSHFVVSTIVSREQARVDAARRAAVEAEEVSA